MTLNQTRLNKTISNANIVNMGSLFITEGSQIRIPVNVQQIVDSYNILNQ